MTQASAFFCLIGAAVSYGSSYVPARSHEVHDGLIFSWYQCLGLALTGTVFSLLANDWNAPVGVSPAFYVHPEGLLCGLIYQVANVTATLAVKKVGLGIYYTLHEFPNVGATLIVGVLGPKIGFPCKVPSDIGLALLGAFFIGLGMVPTMLMKEHVGDITSPIESPADPTVEKAIRQDSPSSLAHVFNQNLSEPLNAASEKTREANNLTWTHFSRQLSGGKEDTSMLDINAHTWDGTKMPKGGLKLLDQFTHVTEGLPSMPIFCDDDDPDYVDGLPAMPMQASTAAPTSIDKIIGVFLSLFAGFLYGLMFMPMPLWEQRMKAAGKDANPNNFMFACCVGTVVSSTAWLLFWSTVKKVQRKKLDKSVLRPALFAGSIYYAALLLEFKAMAELPYAVAYVGCTGLALAASMLWGILVFGEMKGFHNRLMAAISFASVFIGAICLGCAS